MKRISAVLTGLMLVLGSLSNAHATTSYSYTPIDYPGAILSFATSINNAGTIVGGYENASGLITGFSLSGTTYTSFSYPGAAATYGIGINDAGTIVGYYQLTSGGPDYGFSLSGTTYSPLNYPGAPQTKLTGINNAGTIVGTYTYTNALGNHAVAFYLSGGTYTTLNPPGSNGTSYTNGNSINNTGTIVGGYSDGTGLDKGFSLSGTTYKSFEYPGASAEGTWADGINNAGTIAGTYQDASGAGHGFVLSGTTFTPLNYPGGSNTNAMGINDAGTLVGVYTDASGNWQGFLATPMTTTYSAPVVNSPGGTVNLNAQYLTYTGTVTNNSPIQAIGSGGFTIIGGNIIFTNNVMNNAGGMVVDSLGNPNGGFSINQATVIFNTFTNALGATFTTNQSAVTFNGLMTNLGTWAIDPSTIIFRGNFMNSGAVTTSGEDTFEFLGTGTQIFSLGNTNLTIGSLVIGPNAILDITGSGTLTVDGSAMPSGYYKEVNGVIGASAVPIPGAVWLLVPGLACLATLRKKLGR